MDTQDAEVVEWWTITNPIGNLELFKAPYCHGFGQRFGVTSEVTGIRWRQDVKNNGARTTIFREDQSTL